jgi:hypothetical protein
MFNDMLPATLHETAPGLKRATVGDNDIEDSCETSNLQIIPDSARPSGTAFS